MAHGTGLRPYYDPRSLAYGAGAAVELTRPPLSKTWECNLLLDQKQHASCVGCAWTYELAARPVAVEGLTYRFALYQIYWHATELDPWDDNTRDTYAGTALHAGADACRARGYFKNYHWANSLDELLAVISYDGPVVMGIPWSERMDDVDGDGYIVPGGESRNWHAILAHGIDLEHERVLLKNSWGRWGFDRRGGCYLTFDVLRSMFINGATGCFPVHRARQRRRPTCLPEFPAA